MPSILSWKEGPWGVRWGGRGRGKGRGERDIGEGGWLEMKGRTGCEAPKQTDLTRDPHTTVDMKI